MPDEELDFENGDDRFDELESRIEDLEGELHWHAERGLTASYCLGVTLAAILSWDANHAVLWALIHGLLSWFYVIYYMIANWTTVKLL